MSVLVRKDAENAKPVVVSTPYAVASSDAAAVVVEPSAPPPDAVPKPGEVPQELLYVMPGSLQYEAGYMGGISENTRSGETAAAVTGLSPISYLTRILASKVYDVAIETPLELAPKLSEKIGAQIHLKREDMQPVFSFKLRGAYNMMAKLPQEQLDRGVICSSTGNHAQGVALAARRLKCDAVIAIPVTTPEIKASESADLSREIVEDNIKVTMDDFMSALNEVKPAFGAAINTLDMCRLNGMLDCGERHAHIQRTVMTFVEQVSFKVREHLCSLASLKDLVAVVRQHWQQLLELKVVFHSLKLLCFQCSVQSSTMLSMHFNGHFREHRRV
ncbi:hypothetical protein BDL97_09G064900 [Sphagnum fallax]|nr:hypothetical protein BDL97_09G064900 [Sphagnum fallax]